MVEVAKADCECPLYNRINYKNSKADCDTE